VPVPCGVRGKTNGDLIGALDGVLDLSIVLNNLLLDYVNELTF